MARAPKPPSGLEAAEPIIASLGRYLTLVHPADTVIVDGDARRLTQVFADLLRNSHNSGELHVSIQREADWALVRVRDSSMEFLTTCSHIYLTLTCRPNAPPWPPYRGWVLGLHSCGT